MTREQITPFVSAGSALTIVSFDRTTQAAAQEALEDRSLNLALRRRRIRSEVLRIPLDANAATKAFLTDVIAALSGRRLIILAREVVRYPDALELIVHLCDLAEAARIIVIGEGAGIVSHPSASVHYLDDDGRENIEMLADALIMKEPG